MACQALIRKVDTRSRDLQIQHDFDAAEYRRKRDIELADERFRTNTHVQLHKLPLEVFSNILVFLHDQIVQEEGAYIITHLRLAALVFRYWRDVILSTPQLWSYLEDSMPKVSRNWCFQRSKLAPLDITFQYTQYTYNTDHPESLIQKALTVCNRWRSLTMRSCFPETYVEALERCVPVLRYLKLYGRGRHVDLAEGLPLLHLTLVGCPIPWDSSRLRGLTRLELKAITTKNKPTVAALAGIIQASPTLEVLSLCQVEVSFSDGIEDSPKLSLPSLTTFSLEVDSQTGDYLLNRIAFPLPCLRELRLIPWTPASDLALVAFNLHDAGLIEQVRQLIKANSTLRVGVHATSISVVAGPFLNSGNSPLRVDFVFGNDLGGANVLLQLSSCVVCSTR